MFTARAGWVRLLPADKADRTVVSTFDHDLKARLEAAMPGLLRTVETDRGDGVIVITSHRELTPEQQAAMTAIAGPTARFVV
jgi:hypothetical protein